MPATKIVIRNNIKIRGIAEQIVNRPLAEQEALLTSATIAVVHALRVNPDKYNIIFDNTKYDDNTNNEYLALREVSSSFLKILLNQIVDNTMVAVAVQENDSV